MGYVVVPGIHNAELTDHFLASVTLPNAEVRVFPAQTQAPYAPWAVLDYLRTTYGLPEQAPPLRFVAFSAGTVGAIAAAQLWQNAGGRVVSAIALDGWGMPAWTGFPVYRMSHDRFTHWSSRLLGGVVEGFYADPPVPHLELWRSPHTVWGWRDRTPIPGLPPTTRIRTTAAHALHQWLQPLSLVTTSNP